MGRHLLSKVQKIKSFQKLWARNNFLSRGWKFSELIMKNFTSSFIPNNCPFAQFNLTSICAYVCFKWAYDRVLTNEYNKLVECIRKSSYWIDFFTNSNWNELREKKTKTEIFNNFQFLPETSCCDLPGFIDNEQNLWTKNAKLDLVGFV